MSCYWLIAKLKTREIHMFKISIPNVLYTRKEYCFNGNAFYYEKYLSKCDVFYYEKYISKCDDSYYYFI